MRPRFFPPAVAVFEAVFRPFSATRFSAVHIETESVELDPSLPVVLVSNHVSWWDGFLVRALQRRLRPKAPLFTVMLGRELRKHPYFRLMGCVGIEPGIRGSFDLALESIAGERARFPDLCLAFFPQGRIQTAQRRPLKFRSGVLEAIRKLSPVQVVPVGLRIEPLNTMAPHAFVATGPVLRFGPGDAPNLAGIESAVRTVLDDLAERLDRLGEDARRLPGSGSV